MSKYTFITGIAFLLLTGSAVLWGQLFGWHKPYINWKPEKLAHYLAARDRDPNECWDLVIFDLGLRPPSAVLRAACVFEYAQSVKDPRICSLLLPDEYGLACLSEMGGSLYRTIPCSGTYGRNEVICDATSKRGRIEIENPDLSDCSSFKEIDVKEWCYKTQLECDSIKNVITRDDCESGYAFSQKDPSLCSTVQDEKRRQYCEIQINAWLQYPELRDSFYFGQKVPVHEEPASVP